MLYNKTPPEQKVSGHITHSIIGVGEGVAGELQLPLVEQKFATFGQFS